MEPAPDRDEKPPQGDVVRHAGEPDGAEEDRLELPKLVEAVFRHHPAGLRVALAAPVECRPLELEAEPAAGGLEDARAFGHDLFADPVAGNYGDLVSHPVVTSAKTFFAASSASRTIGKPT